MKMNQELKLYKLQFQTADITAEDIRKTYDFSPPSDKILEHIAKAYRALDGIEVIGAEWEYIPNDYSIYGWNKSDDPKIRELFYQYEQDQYFGSYENKRKEFEEEWDKGEYEMSAFHCDKKHFKLIEKVQNQ